MAFSSTSLQADAIFNVQGMVAVITGGATGIGLMMTKALVENGASKVYILARRQEKLDEAAKLAPEKIVGIQCDVTSVESLKAAAAKVREETGHINLLVANSGAIGPKLGDKANPRDPNTTVQDVQNAVLGASFESIQNVFAVNTTGVYYTAFAFLDLLDAGNKVKNYANGKVKSQIITISSVAGLQKASAGGFAYAMSKAAITHLGKTLATFLVPYDIRCNIIAPGVFPSDIAQAVGLMANTEEGTIDKSFIPAQRLGTEFDMGGTILYLSSRAGGFLNGLLLLIDGGALTQRPSTY